MCTEISKRQEGSPSKNCLIYFIFIDIYFTNTIYASKYTKKHRAIVKNYTICDNTLIIVIYYYKFRATVTLTNASDADFIALSSTDLNFGPGNTDETIAIAINDDSIDEDDEIFVVTLSTTSQNVQIDKLKGVTTITIQDNDGKCC